MDEPHFSSFMTRRKREPRMTSFTRSRRGSDSSMSEQMTGVSPCSKVRKH